MSNVVPERSAIRPPVPAVADRGNVRGQATRQKILNEAERLFAEFGIAAVPLRDIGKAAGQRNHAAVQYHFGDRDVVIRAIMEFRGSDSEVLRSEAVAELMMSGNAPTIDDVVGAFVRPLAIHFEPDNHYLPFLARYITEEGGYEGLFNSGIHTGVQVSTLRALLGRLLPDVPEDALNERWLLTQTSAVHALARYHSSFRKHAQMPANLNDLVEGLILYLSAGLARTNK